MPLQFSTGVGWAVRYHQPPPLRRQAVPTLPPLEPQGSSPSTGLFLPHPPCSSPHCSQVRSGWHMRALNQVAGPLKVGPDFTQYCSQTGPSRAPHPQGPPFLAQTSTNTGGNSRQEVTEELRGSHCAKGRDPEVRMSDGADKAEFCQHLQHLPPHPSSPTSGLYLVGRTHAVLISLDQVRAQEHLMQVVTVAAEDLGLQP